MRAFLFVVIATIPSLLAAHPGGLDEKGCHNDRKAGERHCHPERLIAKTLSTCELKKPPNAGDEGVFFGRVIRVSDGDTFEAKVQGVVMDFRLAEADAPEIDQPYGDESLTELRSLLRGQQIVLVPIDTDGYGRTVVFVWNGTVCVNKQMVRRGAAWFYDEYALSDALHAAEEQARNAKVGLWRLPVAKRDEPWVWRKEKR